MTKSWFCQITAGNKGFIYNSAQEHRYREAMFRMAEKEKAEIPEYVCREGKIFVVICCDDEASVHKIIKAANASFGKYLKMAGKNVNFHVKGPEFIKGIQEYVTIRQRFFYSFYVAEDSL